MQGQPDEPPAWAQRIRRERITRGWSQAEAVRAFRVLSPGDPVGVAGMLHAWDRWESGLSAPAPDQRVLLARTFGTVSGAIFPPGGELAPDRPGGPGSPRRPAAGHSGQVSDARRGAGAPPGPGLLPGGFAATPGGSVMVPDGVPSGPREVERSGGFVSSVGSAGSGRTDEPDGAEADLLLRLRSPRVDDRTLAALTEQVDTLCVRYALGPVVPLLTDGRIWLRRVHELLGRRLRPDQERAVLRSAGLLALLIGCLEWDLGLTTAAETSRGVALSFGVEAGDPDVTGWAHELHAWFALDQGDYRDVITAAEAGGRVAEGRPVAAQLAAQAARAWARVGARREVEVALERSRRLLEALPSPDRPGHHFAVDPGRFDLWAMDCYRALGEDRLAAGYAHEVLQAEEVFPAETMFPADGVFPAEEASRAEESPRAGLDPAGGPRPERAPMRATAARLTLAVTAARGGELEAALHHGTAALAAGRTSLPALLNGARELGRVLEQRFPADPRGQEYTAGVRALESRLLRWPQPPAG